MEFWKEFSRLCLDVRRQINLKTGQVMIVDIVFLPILFKDQIRA